MAGPERRHCYLTGGKEEKKEKKMKKNGQKLRNKGGFWDQLPQPWDGTVLRAMFALHRIFWGGLKISKASEPGFCEPELGPGRVWGGDVSDLCPLLQFLPNSARRVSKGSVFLGIWGDLVKTC